MLGTPDLTAGVDFDLEQTDLAQALEMRPHRVDVESETFGDLGSGEGTASDEQLEVHRVPRVVAQRLEHVERRHGTGTRPRLRSGTLDACIGHEERIHGILR